MKYLLIVFNCSGFCHCNERNDGVEDSPCRGFAVLQTRRGEVRRTISLLTIHSFRIRHTINGCHILNKLKNVLNINNYLHFILSRSLTQSIREAAASRINAICTKDVHSEQFEECIDYIDCLCPLESVFILSNIAFIVCLPPQKRYILRNSKNMFVGTGLDLSTNMCVINNLRNMLESSIIFVIGRNNSV